MMSAHAGKRTDFWSKVVATPNGCREWQGTRRQGSGYGQVRVGGRLLSAHRVAWERAFGPIPEGLFVCHRCDNPPCVELTHLFLGTCADNNADKLAKARHSRGEAHSRACLGTKRNPARGERSGNAKLSTQQVLDIRQLAGSMTKKDLGLRYGVTDVLIGKIVRKEIWTHV